MSKVAKLVEQALKEYEICRSSDRHLIVAVWHLQDRDFDKHFKEFFLRGGAYSTETIRRTRQKLQEEGKYPPTDKVKKAREQKFRDMKYNVKDASADELPL